MIESVTESFFAIEFLIVYELAKPAIATVGATDACDTRNDTQVELETTANCFRGRLIREIKRRWCAVEAGAT